MALTYDTKLRIPVTALATTTSAATANYTCGANAKVLVVMVCYAGVTQRTGGAPTYNGVALQQVQSQAGVTEAACELWYMLAPPVSQALAVNVPNDNGVTMWVYVASGNAASGYLCALDSSGITETTGASPSVSLTAVAASTLIFAVVATGDNSFVPTARTGTSLYEEDIATYGSAAQYYVKSGTGAQAMSWTDATSDDYGAIAIAFKEVLAPVVVSPDPASCVAAKVDPTVICSSVSVTPSVGSAIGSKNDPVIVLGSLSIIPGAASGVAGSANPAVIVSYNISDVYDLQAMEDDLTRNYILVNDIDASPANPNSGNWDSDEWPGTTGFRPIGSNSPYFSGRFDGQGHTIAGLFIARPAVMFVGLFSQTTAAAVVQNVCLTGVVLNGGILNVGALIGLNNGAVVNCASNGAITADEDVGGLVGTNSGTISNCYSTGSVSTVNTAGGLVGYSTGPISNSFSRASVESSTQLAGGLVGSINTGCTVSKCYSTGSVSAPSYDGGLVGYQYGGSVTDSFWDTQTSGQPTSDGGTGKTTAEMKDDATFTDLDTVGLTNAWDFVGNPHDDVANNNYWDIDGFNGGYPFLAWQQLSQTITPLAASGGAAKADPTVINNVIVGPLAASCIAASLDPTVLSGANVVVSPGAASCVAASVAPTVILGSLSITPTAAGCVASKAEPTILNNVTLAPTAASAVSASVNPTVVNNVTLSPAASSAVAGKVDPTVINNVTLTPGSASAIAGKSEPSILITPLYSRGAPASLPTDDTDLANLFAGTEYANVEIDDGTRVEQTANSGQYAVFEFKDKHTQQEQFSVSWNGQSSKAPSASTIYLQVYNRTTPAWETLDSDAVTAADTDFTLEGSKTTGLSDYFNPNFEIACRVYQQVT